MTPLGTTFKLPWTCIAALLLVSASEPAVAQTAPYVSLDDVQAPWTNLGPYPVRPMAWTQDAAFLYAIHTEGSTAMYFDDPAGQPAAVWKVPNNPVACALYDGHPDGIPRLLVVCRGTHALLALDRFTGAFLQLAELPHEPADILVDAASHRAFVSCSGANLVREIELRSFATVRDYPIGGKQPTYLAFEGQNVLVAPLISGNNSTILPGSVDVILDTGNPQVSPGGGLPDRDLYRIDPLAGTVAPVLKGTGTALFAQGINPLTSHHWQLNVEARNKDPNKQSEPALRGAFADNRLTISNPAVGAVLAVLDLDDADPSASGVQVDPTRTVSLPTALTFSPAAAGGFALITGLATDNVTVLDAGGSFVVEWDLPAGSLPRAVALDPVWGAIAAVYCWGRGTIELYTLSPFNTTPAATLDLGFDPSPPAVQRGRGIFFDASSSSLNRLTCAHCHVEGKTDLLAWDLSDEPKDTKGPMVTQTLFGIQRVPPFHWRGERPALADFNPAFVGLLGGPAQLSEAEMADFEAFVFSLVPAANPGQDARRVLNDALAQPEKNGFTGRPTLGQQKFLTMPTLGPASCALCHTLPNATSSDVIAVDSSPIGQQSHFDVAHFLELWRKEQPEVTLALGPFQVKRPELGFGLLHSGVIDDLFDFVIGFPGLEGLPQDAADIIAFCRQADQGLAPAAHRAARLRANMPIGSSLGTLLLPQADAGQCSLAVIGRFPRQGVPLPRTFAYVPGLAPGTGVFVCEDSAIPPQTFQDFVAATKAGLADLLFLGLPPGNAEGWIDLDRDDLFNLDEAPWGADPHVADTDLDGYPDGHEARNRGDPADPSVLPSDVTSPQIVGGPRLEWINSKLALITWETDEPTRHHVTYSTGSGPVLALSDGELKKVHRALLEGLLPSTANAGPFSKTWTYGGTLQAIDAAGRTTAIALPTGLTTLPFALVDPRISVLGDLRWVATAKGAGSLSATVGLRVDFKGYGPPALAAPGFVAVARVLRNGQTVAFTTTGPTSFTIFGDPYGNTPDELAGPFLIAPVTDGGGNATLSFGVANLAGGDVVTVAIVAAMPIPAGYNPLAPDFGDADTPLPLILWSFPDTPQPFREISTTF